MTQLGHASPSLNAASAIALLSKASEKRDFDSAVMVINAAKELEATERKDFSDYLIAQWSRPAPELGDNEAVRIRLSIADYLLQDTKNRRIYGDTTPYLAYAREVADGGCAHCLGAALMVLMVGDEPQDLATFRQHLNDPDKLVSDVAALALAQSCHVSESEAEADLQSIHSEKQRAYFQDSRRKYATLRKFCA